MDAAKGLEGATQADLDAIAASEDTRTTDEKMLQEMEMLTDVMIKAIAPDQAKFVQESRAAAMLGTKKVGYDTSTLGTAETAGTAQHVKMLADAVLNTESLGTKVINAQSMVVGNMGVANGGATPPTFAEGGIVPAGFPNDTYPALLTSGESVIPPGHPLPTGNDGALANTMLQVGAMIVSAIKSAGGINLTDRYSV
jgi:hypothetical protein